MKTFLALFTCMENSEAHIAWKNLTEASRSERLAKGKLALEEWNKDFKSQIIFEAGNLSQTSSLIDKNGCQQMPSRIGNAMIVKADSILQAEQMFDQHPHFHYFPGDGVELTELTELPRVQI